MRTKKNALFYVLLLIVGYFIYRFQIEKSFNLLTIYILAVSFSFFSFLFKIDSRKTLPFLFVCSLFSMYGVNNQDGEYQLQFSSFLLLLSVMVLMLIVLLGNYRLALKKTIIGLLAIPLASIYLFKGNGLEDFKYIPFVIGSFFMFRSISFLHEIKFMKQEVPLIDKVNYFLLTPNFSMPLFPIVDYKAFVSSYEGISTNTLKRGTLFICRGLFQMILYRFIYHQIIIPFDEIKTALDVLIFIMANFMIILRVIGAFHIAIGMVVITGYNVPDIFNNIFFSTGFSDLWRRINMYWLNFMLKIFYYPLYFKIKKIGTYKALFISTFACFIITWFLHSYQWFWLKGFFPIELKDAIFWLGFGLLVSINTLWQQKKLEQTDSKNSSAYSFLSKAFSALGILLVMSTLWSIWTSNSLQDWWTLMMNFKKWDLHQLTIILQLFFAYLIIASGYHYFQMKKETQLALPSSLLKRISIPAFLLSFVILQIINVLISKPEKIFYKKLLSHLTNEQLNKADLIMIDNGYYSNLINTNKYCTQIWVNDFDISRRWTRYTTNQTTVPSLDLLIRKGIPFASVKYKDNNYTLNSVGLRDKEYSKIKPDSTYRIVILGGSYECGNGVNDGEDFISLVETELNSNYISSINGKQFRIEMINFSSNGYFLIQRLYQYIDNARYWNPDAVFLFIHTNYKRRMASYTIRLVSEGFAIKDAYLKAIIDSSKIQKTDDFATVGQKLGAYADSLNYYAIDRINQVVTFQDSIKLFPVYLPALKDKVTNKDSVFIETICHNYNLNPLVLTNSYQGEDKNKLTLSDVDFHPNKKANRLIANKLLDSIIIHQDYFNIKFTKK